jgi:hypothetical protein
MCSCGGKRPPAPKSTAVLTCPDKPWDVQCILDVFCKGDAEDREVVKKLPRLTIHNRNPKQVHYKKYQGGKWVDGGFTSGGSANGTTVWVNADTNCCDAASTFYHEVAHTDQPSGMPGSQKEYDAYIKEEQWRIKKGLPPGGHNFRKKVKDPKDPSKEIEVPNGDAIKADVDSNYAYNPPTPLGGGVPPPSVLGLTADGKEVRLSDGTTRPPKEGDAYRLPDTGGNVIETIDPAKWKCP